MPYINFNHIAKRCPNGQWKDPENGECISQAEWKRKYRKNAPIEDNEEKKKGKCPKGYWKDRRTGECIKVTEWKDRPKARDKKKDKDKEPKEEDSKYSQVRYEGGMSKPESLRYVMGFTREAIKKEHPEYFENAKKVADTMRAKLDDSSIWDSDQTTAECLYDVFSDFGEYGDGVWMDAKLNDMPKEVAKSIMSNFADTIEEYPWAMASFGGINVIPSNQKYEMWMSYGEDRQLGINVKRYFTQPDDMDNDEAGIYNVRDPITGETTPWGFDFTGCTRANIVCHEWGHACDIAVFSMYFNMRNKDHNRLYSDPLKQGYDEIKPELKKELEDLGFEVEMQYGQDANYNFGENLFQLKVFRDGDVDIRELNKILEKYHVKIKNSSKSSYGGWSRICTVVPSDEVYESRYDGKKLEYTDSDSLRKVSRMGSRQSAWVWDAQTEFSKKRVNECEELYKELYGLKDIVPSDVWSRYGYYGDRDGKFNYYAGKKSKLTNSASQERMAEAMQDVMVRGEKANSMSQLMVAHMDFEMYQIMTGDFDMTFKDFIKDKIGFDRFKDRIVKAVQTRYISFTPFYSKVRT